MRVMWEVFAEVGTIHPFEREHKSFIERGHDVTHKTHEEERDLED